jgi:RNA polymerase sigma-70 factor (ECF subfamily)
MHMELRAEALAEHRDRLYRAARAISGSHHDAEDLVQETFARVLSRQRRIDCGAATLPYLMRALRNTYVSWLRSGSRRALTAPLDDDDARLNACARASPGVALAAREVFRAIAALPRGQRDVVVAVDFVGLSYAEAAAALAVPVGTIMSRLHRGRMHVAAAVG